MPWRQQSAVDVDRFGMLLLLSSLYPSVGTLRRELSITESIELRACCEIRLTCAADAAAAAGENYDRVAT